MCDGSDTAFCHTVSLGFCGLLLELFWIVVVSVDKGREERNKGLLFELHHQQIHYNRYCSAAEIANYSCMTLTLPNFYSDLSVLMCDAVSFNSVNWIRKFYRHFPENLLLAKFLYGICLNVA